MSYYAPSVKTGPTQIPGNVAIWGLRRPSNTGTLSIDPEPESVALGACVYCSANLGSKRNQMSARFWGATVSSILDRGNPG
jgi:hypothetical protein